MFSRKSNEKNNQGGSSGDLTTELTAVCHRIAPKLTLEIQFARSGLQSAREKYSQCKFSRLNGEGIGDSLHQKLILNSSRFGLDFSFLLSIKAEFREFSFDFPLC